MQRIISRILLAVVIVTIGSIVRESVALVSEGEEIVAHTTQTEIKTWAITEEIDLENPEPQITEPNGIGNITRHLTFEGKGLEIQPEISEDTAVFRTPDGYPAIHLFIPAEVLILHDVTTGGLYFFSGTVKLLDAAAGNRYYEAVSVDLLSEG